MLHLTTLLPLPCLFIFYYHIRLWVVANKFLDIGWGWLSTPNVVAVGLAMLEFVVVGVAKPQLVVVGMATLESLLWVW